MPSSMTRSSRRAHLRVSRLASLIISARPADRADPMEDRPNYITPAGFRRLREEYEQLFAGERPRLVEVISWAAGNGDRSENGDYIYGRKRLREIDRRINWLSRRMACAKVTDPARQRDRTRAWFGATLALLDDQDNERLLTPAGD